MRLVRRLVLIALTAFIAAVAGVYAARAVNAPPRRSESALHAFLHHELKPDSVRSAQIEAIEARFAARRTVLEIEMRAANARLAKAIEAEHGYGPGVTCAVDHVHKVMGDMQKETLEHLFEMRAVMNADEARRFDQSVVRALTADAR